MKTAPHTIRETATLEDARHQMADREIRHLVVVNAQERVVGMLSDRDILRAPSLAGRVRDAMSHDVLVAAPATPIAVVAERMLRGKHDAVPVIGEGAELCGIVTSTDFIELAYRTLIGLDPFASHARA